MVLSRAGRLLPKLLDFGIAKLADESPEAPGPRTLPNLSTGATPAIDVAARPDDMTMVGDGANTEPGGRLTHVGIAMGSPLYMAPEQWSDAATADARTDIYALGILCFEVLTGRPPFLGTSTLEIAGAHARAPVPSLGPAFPHDLDAVVARALAKNPAARFHSALELGAAFRAASGVGGEQARLAQLGAAVREAVVARAPQPLALAVVALDAARNPHQARDALWQVVRVAVRLIGVTALAAHSHVHLDRSATDPGAMRALRRLRGRALSDDGWLELARELGRRFDEMRDAHPVPELVDLLDGNLLGPLDELLRLRSEAEGRGGGSEVEVRELLERSVPLVTVLLDRLSFLSAYRLVVPTEVGLAEVWMGVTRGAAPDLPRRGLAPGRPVLVDAGGVPVVELWPFVQVHAPAPGAAPALFFVEGNGRRGARLIALPAAFEHEDQELWESLGMMLGETAAAGTDEERAPFPGLAAFTAADASSFFGRERETEALVNRMHVSPLLAVVGPSGAGKSSLVQAGVLSSLPQGWTSITVRPGPSPVASLVARLAALDDGAVDRLADELSRTPEALATFLRRHAAASGTVVVLVVDQLEELFTLCDVPEERAFYAEALVRAARSVDDPVRVIVTLRDDFLLRAESLPALRSRLGPALMLVNTPEPPDLERILTEPVRRAGYEFDDASLPEEMVRAVAGSPAALAMLSFTAGKLWELRDRRFRQLGHKAYRSLGGVGGALAHHAESVLKAMPADEQRLVREVFRHLVTSEGTRGVLSAAELDQVLGGGPHAAAVVEKLIGARLLVAAESERVEVAHEALLDAWPRLVAWRREDAEGARLRDQLRAATRQWDERLRPSGLLWRGDALAEYRLWRARYPGALTASEEAFAAASLSDAARGRRLRRLALASVIAGLAVVAVALFIQNTRVERQRARARANEARAEASADELHALLRNQFEGLGRRLLLDDDPAQALAYLHEAEKLGARGTAHDFLVADAVRATGGELYELRHDSMIGRVRFSPDGRRIATAGADDQARLWDAATGERLATLAHDGAVLRIEWSPDGATVATGSQDGRVALWDAATGRRRMRLEIGAPVRALVFSPDGAVLVTVTVADEAAVWALDGTRVATLSRAVITDGAVLGSVCAFSPGGDRLAIGASSGDITLYDRRWRSTGVLRGSEPIAWLAFAPDGRRLVSTSETPVAHVWDTETHAQLLTLRQSGAIISAMFSPDGTRVATGSADRTAIVWDAATGRVQLVLAGHEAAVQRVVFSPDGRQIVTASEDATAQLFDADTGIRIGLRAGHRGPVRDAVFDPRGRLLATASLDGTVIVSSTEPSQHVTVLRGHQRSILSVQFSLGGEHVVTSGLDGAVAVWDRLTGKRLVSIKDAGVTVRTSPDGTLLATTGEDSDVRLWERTTGRPRGRLSGHVGLVSSIEWSPSGAQLVSAGDDGTARVWDVARETEVQRITAHAGQPLYWAGFAPDGTRLATSGADNALRLWDLATGKEVASVHDRDVRMSGAFDRTGSRLASAVLSRTAKIWHLDGKTPDTELVGHVGVVWQVAWSPDNHILATASQDGTARLWDADTGVLLAVLDQQGLSVASVAFAPDGRSLVTGRSDGTAVVWELPVRSISREAFEDLVACRVPYEVREDRVVARPRDWTRCASALRVPAPVH
jgi:WD40 repeat protein